MSLGVGGFGIVVTSLQRLGGERLPISRAGSRRDERAERPCCAPRERRRCEVTRRHAKTRQRSPKLQPDLLDELFTLGRVTLVACAQTDERGAELLGDRDEPRLVVRIVSSLRSRPVIVGRRGSCLVVPGVRAVAETRSRRLLGRGGVHGPWCGARGATRSQFGSLAGAQNVTPDGSEKWSLVCERCPLPASTGFNVHDSWVPVPASCASGPTGSLEPTEGVARITQSGRWDEDRLQAAGVQAAAWPHWHREVWLVCGGCVAGAVLCGPPRAPTGSKSRPCAPSQRVPGSGSSRPPAAHVRAAPGQGARSASLLGDRAAPIDLRWIPGPHSSPNFAILLRIEVAEKNLPNTLDLLSQRSY